MSPNTSLDGVYGLQDGEKIVDLYRTVFPCSTDVIHGHMDEQMIAKGKNAKRCISPKNITGFCQTMILSKNVYDNNKYKILLTTSAAAKSIKPGNMRKSLQQIQGKA